MSKEKVQVSGEVGKLETQLLDQELEVGLEGITLAYAQKRNHSYLFPRLDVLACCEPYVFVACFDTSILSHSTWYKELTTKGCCVKSPDEFLDMKDISMEKNVVMWMVDANEKLPRLLEH